MSACRKWLHVWMLSGTLLADSWAQTGGPAVDVRKPPPISELEDGRLDVGGVIVERATRSASFEARDCVSEGPVEYLLVHESGKVHESVLRTSIEPFYLHTAMLLLGARTPEPAGAKDSPPMITGEFLKTAPKPEGTPVTVTLTWEADGKAREIPAGTTVINSETKATLEADKWVYNGSGLIRGEFLAQSSGSMISIVTDPEALVNYIGEGRTRDDLWQADPQKAPRVDQKVTVTIRLSEPKSE